MRHPVPFWLTRHLVAELSAIFFASWREKSFARKAAKGKRNGFRDTPWLFGSQR